MVRVWRRGINEGNVWGWWNFGLREDLMRKCHGFGLREEDMMVVVIELFFGIL